MDARRYRGIVILITVACVCLIVGATIGYTAQDDSPQTYRYSMRGAINYTDATLVDTSGNTVPAMSLTRNELFPMWTWDGERVTSFNVKYPVYLYILQVDFWGDSGTVVKMSQLRFCDRADIAKEYARPYCYHQDRIWTDSRNVESVTLDKSGHAMMSVYLYAEGDPPLLKINSSVKWVDVS